MNYIKNLNKIKPKLWWLGYLILVPSLILNLFSWQKKDQDKGYSVKEVLDGDTLVIEDGLRIRLANMNSPELTLCGGNEAKDLLESLVLNKQVVIDIQGADSFQRPLAYVFQNNQLINETMVASGWAQYKGGGGSGQNRELLKTASNKAREEKRGIYNQCVETENPDNPKCSIKGNFSQTGDSRGEKFYHFPGCSRYEDVTVDLYRGEQWFCSEKEAQAAGFVKSKNCFDKKFIIESSLNKTPTIEALVKIGQGV